MNPAGYIIEKYDNMQGAYTCHRLINEANGMGINLQLVGANDTYIDNQGIWNKGNKIEKRDFVINRYKYGEIIKKINTLGLRCYNNIDLFSTFNNKYEQLQKIKSDSFLVPKFILSTCSINFELLASNLGIPFVAKGLENSMGREIFLIKGQEDFHDIEQIYPPSKEWLFEEFISTSYGKDLRIFSIRDKTIACMIRKSKNDFRANVALGASVEAFTITPLIENIVSDIYKLTKLDIMGIDLLFGRDAYYFCEINVMPGLEGIETASGINIGKLIVEMIKTDIENE